SSRMYATPAWDLSFRRLTYSHAYPYTTMWKFHSSIHKFRRYAEEKLSRKQSRPWGLQKNCLLKRENFRVAKNSALPLRVPSSRAPTLFLPMSRRETWIQFLAPRLWKYSMLSTNVGAR